jgi:hypothetical protein
VIRTRSLRLRKPKAQHVGDTSRSVDDLWSLGPHGSGRSTPESASVASAAARKGRQPPPQILCFPKARLVLAAAPIFRPSRSHASPIVARSPECATVPDRRSPSPPWQASRPSPKAAATIPASGPISDLDNVTRGTHASLYVLCGDTPAPGLAAQPRPSPDPRSLAPNDGGPTTFCAC